MPISRQDFLALRKRDVIVDIHGRCYKVLGVNVPDKNNNYLRLSIHDSAHRTFTIRMCDTGEILIQKTVDWEVFEDFDDDAAHVIEKFEAS